MPKHVCESDAHGSQIAWYEWWPAYWTDFDGISFSPGDTVTASVIVDTPTSGVAVITNETKNQTVSQYITSTYPLCQQDAEWIVEDFDLGGEMVPFADFGTVTFTSATAQRSGLPEEGPQNAKIYDIIQDEVLTSVSIDGSSVTVTYL